MNKKISVGLAITLALIAMTVTFSITFVLSQQQFTTTVNAVREREKIYSKLAEIDKYVRDNYYGEIDDNKLYDMLGAGYILGTGDPNAVYYTAEQYAELIDIQNGQLLSIGVDLTKDASGYAAITKVYSGSPAEEVGMVKGNYITKVNGTEVKGLTVDTIMNMLRGEEGTSVTVTFLDSTNIPKDVQVSRRKFDASSVEFQLVPNTTYGYVKISSFTNTAPSDFDSAVRQLMSQGATALIFDLRGNKGGILSSAVECIDILAPEGVVAYAQYKDGTVEEMGWSNEDEVNLPMVVLVNGETASSAELFAAELKEFGKAKIVGTTTYGKGTIQKEPQQLSDGSAISITVAALLTGDKNSFNGTGITPDVESVLKADEESSLYLLPLEIDPQIVKAMEVLNTASAAIPEQTESADTSGQDAQSTEQAASETTDETAQTTEESASQPAEGAESASTEGADSASTEAAESTESSEDTATE